ncbi:hypothetical protein ACQR2W_05440 [Clostridium perfringens]|nr:hypothetical protein [Clostridium perfringens]
MGKLLKDVKHMDAHNEVTGKKTQQWYSVNESKKLISFCIQDRIKNKEGKDNNRVDFNKGTAETCIGANDYIFNRFIKKKRDKYNVRVFIKKVSEKTFDEVSIKEWRILKDRINFYFDIE